MNESNLIPFNELTEEKQREIASKGGKASVEARRRKKSLKEAMDLLLSLPLKDKKLRKQIEALGIDPDDVDNQMVIAIAQWKEAAKGNPKAYTNIEATIGEKPIDEVKQTVDGEITTKQKNAVDDVIAQMKPLKEDDT